MSVETGYKTTLDINPPAQNRAIEGPPRMLERTQSDVLQFRIFGISMEQTGKVLRITPDSIRYRMKGVYGNLQAGNIIEASLRAIRYRMVDAPRVSHDDYNAMFSLTGAERGVARQLIADEGRHCSDSEIAETLRISENTVKTHLKRIYNKLHVKDRLQAALIVHGTMGPDQTAPMPTL